MNTTQTQALAPSSTHPCCRDGSGHTNAHPPDDQARISDEHTVELRPRRTCGWREDRS